MNNILFCSAGRRNILLRDAKTSLVGKGQVFATDVSPVAPALFDADKAFLVPRIDSADYNETILRLCKENDVKAITTLRSKYLLLTATNCLRRAFFPFALLRRQPVCVSTSMRCSVTYPVIMLERC